MDSKQRRRMAYKGFTSTGEESGQAEIEYTVQVSGPRVELHREWPEEGANEDETVHDCWVMSLSDLKKLIAQAQWCIEKSEAFEKSHPVETMP